MDGVRFCGINPPPYRLPDYTSPNAATPDICSTTVHDRFATASNGSAAGTPSGHPASEKHWRHVLEG